MGRRATTVAALALVCALGASTPALGAGATGDGAAIRLFRDVAARTNAQPAMQLVQSGYMTESADVRAPSTFTFRWGFGTMPAGYVRSTETITYAQHLGRVVWLTDVLTASAPGCHAATGCPQLPPIQLFVTRVAAFAGVVDRPQGRVGCYVREPFRAVPYRAGGRWWTAVGDFRPLIERGNQVLVTDTYSWADGQHIIERDSIDAASHLFQASSFHVGRGRTAAQAPFGFSQRDTPLAYAPPAPKVTICR